MFFSVILVENGRNLKAMWSVEWYTFRGAPPLEANFNRASKEWQTLSASTLTKFLLIILTGGRENAFCAFLLRTELGSVCFQLDKAVLGVLSSLQGWWKLKRVKDNPKISEKVHPFYPLPSTNLIYKDAPHLSKETRKLPWKSAPTGCAPVRGRAFVHRGMGGGGTAPEWTLLSLTNSLKRGKANLDL